MNALPKIIFSFDDGPTPVDALQHILDTLAQHAIQAEFYLVGSRVQKQPEATRAIVERGHCVQNHSWSHVDLTQLTTAQLQQELRDTQHIIERITGISPTKIRPPFGEGGWLGREDPQLLSVAESLSLRVYNWEISSQDWREPKGVDAAKINTIGERLDQWQQRDPAQDSINILMHVQAETARDLESLIDYLKTRGHAFTAPLN